MSIIDKSPPDKNDTINDDGFIFDVSKKSYTIVDNWLFELDSLSEHEKIVYIVLKRFAFEPTRIFPSHKTIARAASLSVRTVIRAIEGLVRKNLIHVRSQKSVGKSNVYLLCDPSQAKHLHKIASLKMIEGMTEGQTGMSDSQRGMSDSQRGMSDSQRGMSDSHTIITNISTIKTTTTTTTQLLCFLCKKEFSESKLQLDFQKREHEKCPYCLSSHFANLKEIPLSKKTILQILQSNKPEKVFLAIDIIKFQYKNKKIENYQKLLMSLLKKDIILPESYIPYHEQKVIAQNKEKIEKEAANIEERKKREEEAYFQEAEKRLKKLSTAERNKIEKKAKEGLPPVLKNIKAAIKSRMFQIIMEASDEN